MKREKILLIFLTVLSVIIILLVKFFLSNIPEVWRYGQETGEVSYNLSLSYLASLIFYFIIVYLPERRNKRNIYPFIAQLVDRITKYPSDIICTFSTAGGGYSVDETVITLEQIELICKKASLSDKCHFLLLNKGEVTIREFLEYYYAETKTTINQILNYPSIDTTLIKLLNEIMQSNFFLRCRMLEIYKDYEDLNFLKEDFFNYNILNKKLKEYLTSNLERF